ncbi:hypothetical protein ABMA46_10140 [Mesorhizobium sp. CN5-321]|uniref:hypothetical protein n=1 Tax=Mesorhizobium hunchu TaxID=3157708 RepID=UPI0032B8808E
MSTRMNWRNAGLSSKRSLSIRDEAEYRDHDAASRWLNGKAKFMAAKAKKRGKRGRRSA